MISKKIGFEKYEFETLQRYAGLDAIVTLDILRELFPAIIDEPIYYTCNEKGVLEKSKAPSILQTMEDFAMMAYEYIIQMELDGMAYDIPENRKIASRMLEEISILEDKIFTKMGKRINLDSGPEVSKFLYGERGLKAPFQTKSGDDATDGAALLTLAGLDPRANIYVSQNEDLQWLCDMAKRRDIVSVYRTFIATYHTDWVKSDGRVHPSYNIVGTSGFRVSGSEPNLLQLPRPKHGYNVRNCFTVNDGNIFVCADFSSAEVKIAAALSKDKNMLAAIERGLDFHSASASSMLGIPYEEFVHMVEDKTHEKYKWAKHWRQVAKILTFSLIYGSSVNGIAMQLGMDKAEAERIMNLYFKTYSGLQKFIESSHKMAIANKYVVTPFGRRKQEFGCYDAFKGTAAYNASLRNSSNVLVQSTCSDLGLITFAHLAKDIRNLKGMSTACVYDSTENELPLENAASGVEMIFNYMDDFPVDHFDWLDLPIGSEVEIGTRWGNLQKVHRGITQKEIEDIIYKMKTEELTST